MNRRNVISFLSLLGLAAAATAMAHFSGSPAPVAAAGEDCCGAGCCGGCCPATSCEGQAGEVTPVSNPSAADQPGAC